MSSSEWIFETCKGTKIPYSEDEAVELENMWLAAVEESGSDV